MYIHFIVGEASDYRISIDGYSGPEGITDCLKVHRNRPFKDTLSYTGTPKYKTNWWDYKTSPETCANLNGIYRNNGITDDNDPKRNIFWNSFKSAYTPLKRVRMSIL